MTTVGWLSQWIAEQWQLLPDQRTEAAHGKADLLRALTREVDRYEDALWTASGCYHNCDPTLAETRRLNAEHHRDCPVWAALGVSSRPGEQS